MFYVPDLVSACHNYSHSYQRTVEKSQPRSIFEQILWAWNNVVGAWHEQVKRNRGLCHAKLDLFNSTWKQTAFLSVTQSKNPRWFLLNNCHSHQKHCVHDAFRVCKTTQSLNSMCLELTQKMLFSDAPVPSPCDRSRSLKLVWMNTV